jgi:F-type H+-transporting ATPase subunit epsilon
MRFKILLPTEIFMDQEVDKIVAEALNGSFCLLPHHIDFVAALAPSLMSVTDAGGEEIFLAVDAGILVKKGPDVMVSARNAIRAPDLEGLEQVVDEQYKVTDDKEKAARTASARLEADLVRRLMELREHG